MKQLMRRLGAFALVAGLTALSAAPAYAVAQLKFDDPTTPGGTVAYDGTGGALVGTDILFQSIQGIDTTSNAGVTLTCTGCQMDFTTGANTGEPGTGWSFAGGGSIVITGAVYNGTQLICDGTILSGSFDSVSVAGETSAGSGKTIVATTLGTDTKCQGLLDYFGLGQDFDFAATQISLQSATIGAGGSFSGAVTNADLNNTAAIPEPASLALLGLGLLGAAAARRRMS